VIRLFVGYDPVEAEAFHVFCQSVLERASVPVSITAVQRRQVPLTRSRHPLQSNDFSFSRFLVPHLCNYEGWAIFVDCDFLCRWDIADLWQLRDEDKALQVCKHPWEGREGIKYLGTTQTAYPKKCWSSLMLFNNARCKRLTPRYVDSATGLDLHRFKWVAEDKVGDLPLEWNWLVSVYRYSPGARMVHWTEGGPWFEEFRSTDYSEEWRIQREKAMWTKQRASA